MSLQKKESIDEKFLKAKNCNCFSNAVFHFLAQTRKYYTFKFGCTLKFMFPIAGENFNIRSARNKISLLADRMA